jgi:hypothetical protein
MGNFQVIKMDERHWGVYIVNPNDEKDRYLLTSPLDQKSDAEYFRQEFERIAGEMRPFKVESRIRGISFED